VSGYRNVGVKVAQKKTGRGDAGEKYLGSTAGGEVTETLSPVCSRDRHVSQRAGLAGEALIRLEGVFDGVQQFLLGFRCRILAAFKNSDAAFTANAVAAAGSGERNSAPPGGLINRLIPIRLDQFVHGKER
jgi:hypothetical protein